MFILQLIVCVEARMHRPRKAPHHTGNGLEGSHLTSTKLLMHFTCSRHNLGRSMLVLYLFPCA
eukprot:5989896-Pyramimonas_sp.AAC.3